MRLAKPLDEKNKPSTKIEIQKIISKTEKYFITAIVKRELWTYKVVSFCGNILLFNTSVFATKAH